MKKNKIQPLKICQKFWTKLFLLLVTANPPFLAVTKDMKNAWVKFARKSRNKDAMEDVFLPRPLVWANILSMYLSEYIRFVETLLTGHYFFLALTSEEPSKW